MVERQPSKLRVAGSIPVSRSILRQMTEYRQKITDKKGYSKVWVLCSEFLVLLNAHVAQSVEHILGKDEVTGSIPVMGSENSSFGVVESFIVSYS